jgi:pimeloyl-ACP methyl ester carboxylesterase
MIVTPKPREQTRARYPDEEGYVERDGVRVFYEVYGDAPTTFLLFPTSPISRSRLWKAQIPYLSRHVRVITFDPRGNGRSDRPDTAEAYSYWEFVEDGRAILEATRTETALLAGICDGGGWALMLAATHPATALGVAAIAPCVPRLTPSHPNYRRYPSLEPLDTDEGWAKRAVAVAELTGGTLVALEGAGHLPQARHPVKLNGLLREFAASVVPPKPKVRT